MKRMFSLFLACMLITAIIPYAVYSEGDTPDEREIVYSNLLKVTDTADFEAGTYTNLVPAAEVGDGALRLAPGATEGTFVSAVYTGAAEKPLDFEYLVASWNADLPQGSWIEVKARAYIQATPGTDGPEDAWTQWLSWGKWSQWIRRGSTQDSDSLAYMDTDIFSVKGSSGGTKVQLMAVLSREDAGADAPVLRQLAATWKNTNDGRAITPEYAETPVNPLPASVRLDSPAYSQMIRDPAIGNSICSPTTISVMLNDRDPSLDLLPEEVALNVQDYEYGFGNWSFCVAGAGVYGFEAYTQYGDFDILMQELANGNSVGLSVSYSTDSSKANYLENAPVPTPGHLITITGYYTEGDEIYFYSSDSAAPADETASGQHRIYKKSQLDIAWGGRNMYIIPGKTKEANAGGYAIRRIDAALTPAQGLNEYTLSAAGQEIKLPVNFTTAKTSALGRGTLAYTVEGFAAKMPAPAKEVTANHTFFYDLSISDQGALVFNVDQVFRKLDIPVGVEKQVTFYVIYNDGRMYTAETTMSRDAGVLPAPMIDAQAGELTPKDFDVLVEPEGETTRLQFLGSEIPSYKRTAEGAAGRWVGVAIAVPVGVTLDGARFGLGAQPEVASDLSVTETRVIGGATYAVFYMDAAAATQAYLNIDWRGDGTIDRYLLDAAQLMIGEPVAVTGNNAMLFDTLQGFEQGVVSSGVAITPGGVTLQGAEKGYYLSPVLATDEFEWLIASWNAVTPGASSVEVEVRAYALREPGWSGWYSFGVWGTGLEGGSKTAASSDYVAMNTDIFSLRGDSSVASANRFQLRVTLRGDGEAVPTLYALSASYKKELAGKVTTGAWIGETAQLPAQAKLEVPAYSLWAYDSGNVNYRFENLMLMALNGQGADLLYEEVLLGGYDFAGGYGNWAFTPNKAAAFGYTGYAQYNATPEMVRQAIANGYVPIVYLSAANLNATNKGTSRQAIVYGYETQQDGTIVYYCICPCGDLSELQAGDAYYTCTEAELVAAIEGYSSASARSLAYFIGPKTADASFVRKDASLKKQPDSSYQLWADGNAVTLADDFIAGARSTLGGGRVVYYIQGEVPEATKLAEQKLYYDMTVHGDGHLVIPAALQEKLTAGATAQVFVVVNSGTTYHARLVEDGAVQYTDVKADDWFYQAVQYVTQKGIMTGTTEDAFAPELTMTRGMLVTAVYRQAGEPEVEAVSRYADVKDGQWYSRAVAWADGQKLVTGYSTEKFGLNDAVTREQLVAILHRRWQLTGGARAEKQTLESYTDASAISEYAREAMQWAVSEGILTGRSDGTLDPAGQATRAEVAAMLQRFAAVGTDA